MMVTVIHLIQKLLFPLPEIIGTFTKSNSTISLSVDSSLASTEASTIVVSGISQSGSYCHF